jgi:hypothetical protein
LNQFNNVGAIPSPFIIMHIKHQVYMVSKNIYGYILIKIMRIENIIIIIILKMPFNVEGLE